jgi:PAS domain S-box-containing protein
VAPKETDLPLGGDETPPPGAPGSRTPGAWLGLWLGTAPGVDHRPAALRYGFALAAVALAVALRLPFHGLLRYAVPFLFFFPAIMASAWFGGLGPGLLATASSALLADYLYFAPPGAFSVTPLDLLQIALFLAVGSVISGLSEGLHAARRRVEADRGERERLAGSLQESEERFQITADSAPVLIWMAADDRCCDWFNRAWLEFTGRSMEEEIGQGWAAQVHPDDLDRANGLYATSFDARQSFRREFRLRRADGEYRWLLDHGVPRYTPEGTFAGYIGSCVDITERKEAEEEHRRLLARAEEARNEAEGANRAKDEFLATLSHELRTPLNAILGWAQMLRLRPDEPEIVDRGLTTIARSVHSQTQLIEDLLDVSRITSGKMRLDVRPVELVPVVEAALESIRPAAEAKGIRLQRVFDPLGPVAGDPDRLQQVVWNLLANAVKFTPKGGKIQVLVSRVNSHVEIVIADTGVGIAPEFLPHVFERFRQADSSSRRQYGGLGLGLAIVRHLVELHGGTVEATSAGAGQGAVFTVCLPLAAFPPVALESRTHPTADPTALAMSDLAGDPGLAVPDLAGIRVLVVEDDPDARELVARVLAGYSAEVVAVGSAAEGLAELIRHPPHVLLSDIEMPGEDGYSLIAKVRALAPEAGGATPAAALTAFARGQDRRRALQAGFQLHVAKPVEPIELATVVANLAGRNRRSTPAS